MHRLPAGTDALVCRTTIGRRLVILTGKYTPVIGPHLVVWYEC